MAVAVVLAAGKGSRMKSDVAKQFMLLGGKEVIYYSLKTFQESPLVDAVVLVTTKDAMVYCQENIVSKYGLSKVIKIIEGGNERYDSVYCALKYIESLPANQREMVLIHDGARPFVTELMIEESLKAAELYSSCTTAVPVKDTIKVVKPVKGLMIGCETPDRSTLYQIQTPQTFRFDMINSAYKKMLAANNYNITDDTMVAEQYEGMNSIIVPGSYFNIKITTPEDLEIAEKFLEKMF